MLEMVKQITSENGSTEAIDLGALLDDIMRFLRNDIASKQIGVSVSRSRELTVHAQKHKLRLILLGQIAQCIDDCETGSELRIRLDRSNSYAVLELSSTQGPQAPRKQPPLEPRKLVLDMARQWLCAHGGRMEQSNDMHGRADLKIFYPVLS